MLKQLNKFRAQSLVEYMFLVVFILGAFLISQKYIVRGMSGRWKDMGDTYGYGQVYIPNKTSSCRYDYLYNNRWYNADCYDQKCDCESVAFTATGNILLCQQCILNCTTPVCD